MPRHLTLALLTGFACSAALAADIQVTKTEDGNDGVCNADCSLREAIQQANATVGEDRILLPAGSYRLSLAPLREGFVIVEEDANLNGDLDVRYNDLVIVGTGQDRTIIDAENNSRLFDVHVATRLRLERLTLRNGRTSDFGGAIRNRGSLVLDQVALENNEMFGEIGAGGAIANFNRLDISASRFSDNSTYGATGYGQGGAIYNHGCGSATAASPATSAMTRPIADAAARSTTRGSPMSPAAPFSATRAVSTVPERPFSTPRAAPSS